MSMGRKKNSPAPARRTAYIYCNRQIYYKQVIKLNGEVAPKKRYILKQIKHPDTGLRD